MCVLLLLLCLAIDKVMPVRELVNDDGPLFRARLMAVIECV